MAFFGQMPDVSSKLVNHLKTLFEQTQFFCDPIAMLQKIVEQSRFVQSYLDQFNTSYFNSLQVIGRGKNDKIISSKIREGHNTNFVYINFGSLSSTLIL
jgi:hypothetical protein